MTDVTEIGRDGLPSAANSRTDLVTLQGNFNELERKLNLFSTKMMAEVIRIDTKIDTQGLENIRQQTVYQQNMTRIQDQVQNSSAAIQTSLSTIISGFGLDRGPEGADALRRDLIWLRDSREGSRRSKGVVWETAIKWLVPTLLLAMLYGLLPHSPILAVKQ